MNNLKATNFVVFGLGRFGTSLVHNLVAQDVAVMVVDKDAQKINDIADRVDQAVIGDASDEDVLDKIGIGDFDVAIFAMGEEFEATIMSMMMAKEKGTKRVVVKALDPRQAQILTRLGADQVVLPEVEMGEKIAKSLVNPNILDVIDQANGIAISEIRPDTAWINHTIAEADIRQKAKITVIAIIRNQATIMPVTADLTILADDILIVIQNKG
ncbi:potassium channel family protein [Lacticaseibacillus brantae]|uniref:Trk family K+ transporter n=1 Tax=Lacticaseibacillus brantae DSM 23927 TaxID=1423727 RepID=A0A0R2AY71_9LACO|nr:TrkA family potassium uptake protein [Lacticaseibacillus brantae]KRM71690.1 Trk family K+ transporter [Lacticaseibacillus brantae DSM 23927]